MVFISYARKDREVAKHFEDFLISIGFSVWIDYRELLYITDFYSQIRKAINMCDMVVFLNSINSNSSGWVHFEKKLVKYFSKPHIEFDIENPNKTLNSDFFKLRRFAMQFKKLVSLSFGGMNKLTWH